MDVQQKRWGLLAASIMILMLASGCFQQAATGPEALLIAELGPTFTPNDGFTDPAAEPTQDSALALPTETPTEDPALALPTETPTEDPALALPTETPAEDPALALPTETPTPDFALLFPTETPTPDFALLFPTETPAGLDVIAQLPTEDVNLQPPAQDIDPVFLTATAIIANATATEAFNLTQTAAPFFATATPTPDPLIFPTATSEIAPPVTGGQCIHYVLRGENLFRLSLRYGVPLTQIQAANPRITNINFVLVCQPITIPNCGTTGAVPPAPPAECLNTSLTPQPGQPLPPTTSTCGPTYRVEQGDTLFKISLRCNVPVMSIARANGIADINIIYINQELTIPSS